MAKLTVALFQNDSVVCNPATQIEALRESAEAGADLLTMPESFLSGYIMWETISQISPNRSTVRA